MDLHAALSRTLNRNEMSGFALAMEKLQGKYIRQQEEHIHVSKPCKPSFLCSCH